MGGREGTKREKDRNEAKGGDWEEWRDEEENQRREIEEEGQRLGGKEKTVIKRKREREGHTHADEEGGEGKRGDGAGGGGEAARNKRGEEQGGYAREYRGI